MTIDLTQAAAQMSKRQVVLRFTTPNDSSPPRGTVYVHAYTDNRDGYGSDVLDKLIPLEDGIAKFDAYVPGQLVYWSKGMLGYWSGERSCVNQAMGRWRLTCRWFQWMPASFLIPTARLPFKCSP